MFIGIDAESPISGITGGLLDIEPRAISDMTAAICAG